MLKTSVRQDKYNYFTYAVFFAGNTLVGEGFRERLLRKEMIVAFTIISFLIEICPGTCAPGHIEN